GEVVPEAVVEKAIVEAPKAQEAPKTADTKSGGAGGGGDKTAGAAPKKIRANTVAVPVVKDKDENEERDALADNAQYQKLKENAEEAEELHTARLLTTDRRFSKDANGNHRDAYINVNIDLGFDRYVGGERVGILKNRQEVEAYFLKTTGNIWEAMSRTN